MDFEYIKISISDLHRELKKFSPPDSEAAMLVYLLEMAELEAADLVSKSKERPVSV